MIVADASALLAIMFAEPECERFLSVLQAADHALVSPVSVVEARRVIHARRGLRAALLADDLLRLPLFSWVAPGREEADAA